MFLLLQVAVTRGKLDLDTKMVIFATAEEDYVAIVENNMELYAKLDFIGQQAEDMLEEAIEKERVKYLLAQFGSAQSQAQPLLLRLACSMLCPLVG